MICDNCLKPIKGASCKINFKTVCFNCAKKNTLKKRPKYGNTSNNGYDSKLENKHALELKLLAKTGNIKDLEEQVKINIEVFNPKTKQWQQLSRRYCLIDFRFKVGSTTILLDSKGYLDSNMAQSVKYQLLEYMIEAGRLPNHRLILEKSGSLNVKNILG